MKLHVIFGQRKCNYPGEYAPEALDFADECIMDNNSDFLEECLTKHKKDDSLQSVGILIVHIPNEAIDNLLFPRVEVQGEIIRAIKQNEITN